MRSINDDMRSKVLGMLFDEMTSANVAANLVKKGESGSDFDILICRLDGIGGDGDVMGQFFFPNFDGPENVMYYSSMLTLKEGLSDADMKRLAPIVADVNEQTVVGHFVLYKEIGLVYKLTIPISEDLDEDDVYDQINIATAHAISMCTSFKGLFD